MSNDEGETWGYNPDRGWMWIAPGYTKGLLETHILNLNGRAVVHPKKMAERSSIWGNKVWVIETELYPVKVVISSKSWKKLPKNVNRYSDWVAVVRGKAEVWGGIWVVGTCDTGFWEEAKASTNRCFMSLWVWFRRFVRLRFQVQSRFQYVDLIDQRCLRATVGIVHWRQWVFAKSFDEVWCRVVVHWHWGKYAAGCFQVFLPS